LLSLSADSSLRDFPNFCHFSGLYELVKAKIVYCRVTNAHLQGCVRTYVSRYQRDAFGIHYGICMTAGQYVIRELGEPRAPNMNITSHLPPALILLGSKGRAKSVLSLYAATWSRRVVQKRIKRLIMTS